MDFEKALEYLTGLGHETLTIKLGLTNIERLLDALDHPEGAFPAVQIAGTNGKGSTAAMLDAICRAAGIKSGLYTSPHLVSYTERMRLGGEEIARDLFAAAVATVREAAHRLQREHGTLPTFFEQLTAAALIAFREAGVGIAILETGLGGRLDATTAARAETVAITPIALDHQEYLGPTLGEIAAEKAAIIRRGVAVVVAPQLPAAARVIDARCRAEGVTPLAVEIDPNALEADACGRLRGIFRTAHDLYENVALSLPGRHQAVNAAVAITLAEALCARGFPIPREAIIRGLARTRHAGRLELRPGAPSILFDGAHNAAGARALRRYLDEFVSAPVTLIFGAMRDKALAEIAATLVPAARRVILTRPGNARAATLDELTRALPRSLDAGNITRAQSVAEAIDWAREQTPPEGVICITGSLYLVGEAFEELSRR